MPESSPTDSLEFDSAEPLKPSLRLELQPTPQSWIWQGNQLAVSRYQLGEVEQKLLLYAIAMLDGKDAEFRTYRINVAAYAEACGIATHTIYNQLQEAAKTIRDTPLMVQGHRSKEGKIVDLYTSWFVEVEAGSGYIDVMFAPSLRPYLLGVKREFFKAELSIPLHLSGEYTIRLYQLCKRWRFAGSTGKITVGELRMMLGLSVLDGKGNIVKERLPKYGDAKKWAILPALAELARSSDILVGMKEHKKPKTKLVEAVEFTIRDNPAYQPDLNLPKLLPGVKVAAPVDPAVAAMRETLLTEFQLSPEQTREALGKYPLAYIAEKTAIARVTPTDNVARLLVAALKRDFKAPKSNKLGKIAKKAVSSPAPDPVREPEPADPAALARWNLAMERRKEQRAKRAQAASVPAAAVAASEGDELPF